MFPKPNFEFIIKEYYDGKKRCAYSLNIPSSVVELIDFIESLDAHLSTEPYGDAIFRDIVGYYLEQLRGDSEVIGSL